MPDSLKRINSVAPICELYGVEIDINKDILFVDRSNHRIKRISNNKIYTVAGKGGYGYHGDGGDALKAKRCKPSGVAVHHSGKIFIADTGNHCLRTIEKGIITTVAGCGQSGYSGDGGDAVKRPGGGAVDNDGNLYTNDYGNNVIRKIDWKGIITTIAGNGAFGYGGDGLLAVSATLNKPYGLCVDQEGKTLYIADYGNHCVRVVDMATGIIHTLAEQGRRDMRETGGMAGLPR